MRIPAGAAFRLTALPSSTQGGSPVRESRPPGSVRGRPVTGVPTAIPDLVESFSRDYLPSRSVEAQKELPDEFQERPVRWWSTAQRGGAADKPETGTIPLAPPSTCAPRLH
jgi:hypothetical protein